jgi:glycolate oxidase
MDGKTDAAFARSIVDVGMKAIDEFVDLLGPRALLHATDRMTYETDAVTLEKFRPRAVLLPDSTEETRSIVGICNRHNLPYVTRGAGTGLSGGALALKESVMIVTTRMNRVVEVNASERWAIVEPGVVNSHLTRAVTALGLHFAPDPSSGAASTIGGNIAENAGGPHCLKYGATAEHVLGLEAVLPNAEVLWVNLSDRSAPLLSLMIGSEGTLGIITKAKVRLTPIPERVETLLIDFPTPRDAAETVTDILSEGIIPAALEMIDAEVLDALEQAFHLGFPIDAGALLLIELDGRKASMARLLKRVTTIANDHRARTIRIAASQQERNALWRARKRAFGALGRVSPSYYTQDGVIPRGSLAVVLEKIALIGKRHKLRIANIFHAGDGNLHPAILYDERDPAQVQSVLAASKEILELCISEQGSITGEHGVGIEKQEALGRMFVVDDIAVMERIRAVFNPEGRMNPHKFLPTDHPCVEVDLRYRQVSV